MSIVPHDDVPNELWMDIFEAMDVPQDLHAVVLTCKKFYFCGIRALLRDLIWSNPKDVAANLPAWGNRYARNENAVVEPLLATDVRSLCLGVSCVPDTFQVTFVDESGQEHDGPLHVIDIDQDHDAPPEPAAHLTLKRSLRYYQLAERTHFATISLYSQMCQRIVSFTNIEKLECKNLVFTDELFGVIHSLPALRKLYVELCLFPPRQAIQARDHTLLPITELKLLNLRRRVTQGHEFAAGVNGALNGFAYITAANGHIAFVDLDDDLTHVLKLALASNLRKLHIDSTADVLGRVFTVWDNTLPGYVYHVPQNLHSLHISKKAYHHGQVQPQFAGEQFFPDRALYALFSRCPTLQTISLEYQLPRHTAFPDDCLPHLRNAEGLAEAVIAMGKNRALQAISILWSDNILYGTLESLNQIALDHGPRLKMLAVECPKWDEEVLHAVCILFPELRRLKLTFWAHGPREDTIVSLGPLFLSRLPHLHTIQVYQTQSGQVNALPTHPSVLYDSSFGSIEEEMRDLVIPWNKFCPNLRTVQLSAGWKMARVGMKGGWEVQRVRRNEPEDFTF
ncbi:hypothetical protein EUX98_g8263 [Antrodiella citrinella]|uniref:F-box domain-containing protein n=1 Tax=Antrodiella citrinella TaxID=2447956 RepID=A0A4S4M8Z3_9APHY|nr:hypothetical protein EUX98_g8263 [Antrodiella citrinella]